MITEEKDFQALVQQSKQVAKKHFAEDPAFWEAVKKQIDYIALNGKLLDEIESEEFSNDLIFTLSRTYCTPQDFKEMNPLYLLWLRANRE